MEFMREKVVMVSRVHERNDLHSCVSEFVSILPSLEKVVSQMVCIPVGWWLKEGERAYIVECIEEWSTVLWFVNKC